MTFIQDEVLVTGRAPDGSIALLIPPHEVERVLNILSTSKRKRKD